MYNERNGDINNSTSLNAEKMLTPKTPGYCYLSPQIKYLNNVLQRLFAMNWAIANTNMSNMGFQMSEQSVLNTAYIFIIRLQTPKLIVSCPHYASSMSAYRRLAVWCDRVNRR